MMAIGFGPQEGIILLVILILLFGASRLPELGKSLGKGIKEFRKASKALTEEDDEEEKKTEEKA